MFGKGYVFEHILFKLNEEKQDKLYKIYITDTLKALNDNLTTYIRGGSVINKRWIDLATKKVVYDNRTGREIADDIIKKAGLIFEEGREGE